MRSKIQVTLLLCGMVLLNACGDTARQGDNGTASSTEMAEEAKLPPDFMPFYSKFHADSAFQMEHIIWPLKGLPDQADAEVIREDHFYFQKDNWRIHHELVDPDGEFDHYFALVDDKLIVERIETAATNLAMERRFAKMNGTWHLIYYSGMNPMKKLKAN